MKILINDKSGAEAEFTVDYDSILSADIYWTRLAEKLWPEATWTSMVLTFTRKEAAE